MELREIIEARVLPDADRDPLGGLLLEIQKLDAKREENIYRLIEKTGQVERKLRGEYHERAIRDWLEKYRGGLLAAAAQHRERFGSELADALQSQGIRLRGQYPTLYAGLFQLDLKFDTGRCQLWYGPKQEDMGEAALDAPKLAERISATRSGLGSDVEPRVFVTRIQQAYRHARLDSPSGSLALPALLPYIAIISQSGKFLADPRREYYHEYTRADLSYDLFRFRTSDSGLRLRQATRGQTQKRSDFLWVPTREDVEGGDYFSTVELKEDET